MPVKGTSGGQGLPCSPPRAQLLNIILKSRDDIQTSAEFLLKYGVQPYSEFLMSKIRKVIRSKNWH